MTLGIEIIHIHDCDADHEVGGQDLPFLCTARIYGGTVGEAIAMMRQNYGSFRKAGSYNLEAKDNGTITFKTFEDDVTIGKIYEWEDSYRVEGLKSEFLARIFQCIERRRYIAVMQSIDILQVYARAYWWEKYHPDPQLSHMLDRNGNKVCVGQVCSFAIDETGRQGTGWVIELRSPFGRPIGYRPIIVACHDFAGYGGIGIEPTELEVIDEIEEVFAIKRLLVDGVPRDFASRALDQVLERISGKYCIPSTERLRSHERDRWFIESARLQTQVDLLKALIDLDASVAGAGLRFQVDPRLRALPVDASSRMLADPAGGKPLARS